jgi:unsaturated rhamnogalacturonyl hydrolase
MTMNPTNENPSLKTLKTNLSRGELAGAAERAIRFMLALKNPNPRPEVDPIDMDGFEAWEWTQGVGLYGLFKYGEASGDPKWRALVEAWFGRRAKEPPVPKNINTMAPLLTLACLCEPVPAAAAALSVAAEVREARLALCREWAEWALDGLPRTEDGGFQHITTIAGRPNTGQLWVDTLFMTVLFVAKYGLITGRREFVEEAERQFLIHIKYLFARQTGLWHHGWSFIGRHNFANAHWARGNCWFTAAVVDFLEMAAPAPVLAGYLKDTLRAQVEALARFQDAGGLWHTLIDDASSYLEVSGASGFCHGILKGVRLGYLDKKFEPVGLRALGAVLRNVKEDGCVDNVSYGTPMGHDFEFYRKIPIQPMPYGQSLAVLALTEGMRHV